MYTTEAISSVQAPPAGQTYNCSSKCYEWAVVVIFLYYIHNQIGSININSML